MIINKILFLITLGFIILVFRNVFLTSVISGGDYISPFSTYYFGAYFPFSIWDPFFQMGWGDAFFLHYAPVNALIGLFGNLTPMFADRIVWWLPFIFISFVSSYSLTRVVFPKGNIFFLSFLIFIFNSYILMILGGGQIAGIGLGYSLTPLFVAAFLKLIDNIILGKYRLLISLIAGALFSLILIIDIRTAFINIFVALVFILIFLFSNYLSLKAFIRNSFFIFAIPLTIVFLTNAFWLIPAFLTKSNPVGSLGPSYSASESVRFFSFATFENTFALFHPNWPENVFGKVGFLQPEFLIIPLLSFLSLLFVQRENKKTRITIISFSIIGLIGAFLSKGTNEPLGILYTFLFEKVPGFVMFRDPTKWLILVVISYIILIPFSITQIGKKFSPKGSKKIAIIPVLFVIFWMFTIRESALGMLGGTFKPHSIPAEYTKFNNYLSLQKDYFKTLWVPQIIKFGKSTITHPGVSFNTLFGYTTSYDLTKINTNLNKIEKLQNYSIKYIVVPYDSEGEIFLDDGKYTDRLYESTVITVAKNPLFKNVINFGKIRVFEVPDPKDHFWSPNKNVVINYKFLNPTEYEVNIQNAKKDDLLVFSESYNKNWVAKYDGKEINSQPFDKTLNSFNINNSGDLVLKIVFTPQKWVNIGLIISGSSSIILVGLLIYLYFKK